MGYELLLSADDILYYVLEQSNLSFVKEIKFRFFYYEVSVRLLLGDVINNHE